MGEPIDPTEPSTALERELEQTREQPRLTEWERAEAERERVAAESWLQLATAHEQRTQQLYETRGALAEAVATLTEELAQLHAERDRLVADNQTLRDDAHRLTASLQQTHREAAAVAAELEGSSATAAAVTNLKVVRWTAPLRQAVYRLRTRHR